MWRVAVLCLVSAAACADDRWVRFHSGPFEVYTNAGARAGRETAARFSQFRHALGYVIGDQDLQPVLPIRALVFKSEKERASYGATGVLLGRDRFAILLASDASAVPRGVLRQCARLLLEANTARMPPAIEHGLIDLFSTVEVSGIRIALGAPLPPLERTKEWAKVHLLATSPEYYGKLRVLLANLRNGIEEGPAYRNSVGKNPADIEQEAARYLAAGNFPVVPISAKPMNPERDLLETAVEPAAMRLAFADLLLGRSSQAAYEALLQEKVNLPEAYEGLGLLALREKRNDPARELFAKAIEAGSQSAGTHLEYARLESDSVKALSALQKAAQLNPKLAEPHFLMAQRENDAAKRIQHLKAAISRDPRNVVYWQELAEAQLAEKQFAEAAKAWRGAEQAATTDEQRGQMKLARLAIEQQRLDYEDSERKRLAEEKQRELQKLKEAAVAEVRALEDRFNQGKNSDPGAKVVPWWDGPQPGGRVTGVLKQVDCLGKQFRLVIEGENRKLTMLLMVDPSRIALAGGGEQSLTCGAQKVRRIAVEYFPKVNHKLGTAGEVATIEFQ